MDLDDLLARSAPPLATRDVDLDSSLRQLVRASGPRPRSRRRIRLVVGSGVAAGVLGLGVAGAAAMISDGALWFTTTESGDACEMEFSVHPVGPEDAPSGEIATIMDGRTTWPGKAEQDAVATAARRYLAAYDYDAIDREAAVKRTDAEQRRIIAEAPPGEAQPLLVGDELEMHAVSRAAIHDLTTHLQGLGMDPNVIIPSVGSSRGCSE